MCVHRIIKLIDIHVPAIRYRVPRLGVFVYSNMVLINKWWNFKAVTIAQTLRQNDTLLRHRGSPSIFHDSTFSMSEARQVHYDRSAFKPGQSRLINYSLVDVTCVHINTGTRMFRQCMLGNIRLGAHACKVAITNNTPECTCTYVFTCA